MTNKEAIATLKAIRSEHDIKRNGLIALDLAIAALEKETLFLVKSDGTIEVVNSCENCWCSQKRGDDA